MSKVKLRMTLDEIYEVDLSKCDFSYMNEKEIKKYLISEFLKNCDKESVRVEVVSNKQISSEWMHYTILETIDSYELEFERELTTTEIHFITSSIKNNRFDHDDILRSMNNKKQKKQQ